MRTSGSRFTFVRALCAIVNDLGCFDELTPCKIAAPKR